MKKIIINIYEKIFQEKITSNTQLFIKNLGYITIGYGIAAFCVFSFQILAGRILGPTEYGKYVLVDSLSLFLYVFMLLGINTAMIKYLAGKSNYKEQKKIISTAYLMVFLFSIFSVLFFFIFSSYFSKLCSVPLAIFHFSIIFAFFYSFYTLTIDTLRGLHQMKKLSIFRACYGICALIIFILFLFNKYISFKVAIFSISFTYLIIFLLIIVNLRKYFSLQFDKFLISKFLKYGFFAVIGSLCFAFLPSFSKILVNKYLDAINVGIYNAYYFSSIGVVIFLSMILITVFFPTISKYQQKKDIFNKIKLSLPYLFLLGIPIIFCIEWMILTLYGSQYTLNYFLMLLFALVSVLIGIYGLYNWIFYSEGILGIKIATGVAIIVAFINIFLSFYLITFLALFGVIISLGIATFIGIICLLFLQKKIIYEYEKK